MDYERIILELLSRIQKLEEQVEVLMENQDKRKEKKMMTINDIREYITDLKRNAREQGAKYIVLKSGDIHKELGLKRWLPPVCKAMRDCMEDGDVFLHTTPSGNSSTIEIKYNL